MYANWIHVQSERPTKSITFLHADATELPLPNESADEVIASNIFGRGANDSVLSSIYAEAMRVLKPDGKFIIHDNLTPVLIGPNSLAHWLRDNGMPRPSNTSWLNFRTSYYAYIEAAKHYGLPCEKLWNDSPEELERIKWSGRESTIWILGKAATVESGPKAVATTAVPEPEQPLAQAAESDSPVDAYQRWKAAFGRFFDNK